MSTIFSAFLLSKLNWEKITKFDIFFYTFIPTAQPNQQHCVSFDPRLFSCHLIGSGKDSCQDVSDINAIKRLLKSAVTSVCLTCCALPQLNSSPPQGEHAIMPNPTPCTVQKPFLHIPHTCLWFTEQVTSPACLNSCFSDDPPFLTGVGRLLVCCSLSSSPLLVRPAGDLMHSLYWGHMNNLSFEFSPTLTFRCLMPTGFGFNNIDSAPFLCASSDKVWKNS